MTEENHDVFADEVEATVESQDDAPQEAQAESEAQPGAETEEKQGEQQAEPPAATENADLSKEKMIPESRFKAALKDVNEKLSKAEQRLAELSAAPAPDRQNDPEGYDRHVRIETSKAIMAETHDDYDEKIAHFQEMAQANPTLNDLVGNHALPAKFAYDLAKRDMEINELSNARNSDEWKQFQEWKKNKGAAVETAPQKTEAAKQLSMPKAANVAAKVPNLNRNATAVNVSKQASEEDEDLFKGHHSLRM